MTPVRRNMYIQLGGFCHGKWYPLRKFHRHFNQRWSNPKNKCKLKIGKPRFVDMLINRDERRVKRVYRGILVSKRAKKYVLKSIGKRKNMDYHRVRV